MFEKVINEVMDGKFQLIAKGTLTQRAVLDPVVLTGTAVIDLGDDSNLRLQFICEGFTGPFDPKAGLPEPEQGKTIEESFHFDLSAIDKEGGEWTAQHLRLDLDRPYALPGLSTVPSGFDTLTGGIQELALQVSAESSKPERHHIEWIVPGTFQFPLRGFPKPWTHEASAFAWSVNGIDPRFTRVQFHGAASDFPKQSRDFLRGLSMLCSQHLMPKCITDIDANAWTLKIRSMKRQFESDPLLWIHPNYKEGWESFLEKWVLAEKSVKASRHEKEDRSVQDVIYQYWYRVHRGHTVDFENGAQVLSSTIEGMVKKYFDGAEPNTESDKAKSLRATIEHLQGQDKILHAPALSLLTSKLDMTRRKDESFEGKFDALIVRGIATDEMKTAWDAVRNDAAHGDHLIKNTDDIEGLVDHFYPSFELFKRLVMVTIGYHGPATDLSAPGWPTLPVPGEMQEQE
ncbi:hypothetical protein [Stenotrophomonas sp.]|uniref:hypothetical protein n=1 Tax=Stenotrophomonas sp. TaxID=69392 RepID=UPI0029B6B429|nr:hypothetical protein [Stenotrophomonas sp.]MDX3934359.1 hypothetical protein [Stenotrophomonas sp.]